MSSHCRRPSVPVRLGRCLILAAALIATPHLATSQGMGGGTGRGGGRRHGSRGGQSRPDADQRRAAADSAMEQRGFAEFVLDHAQALTLTPGQRLSIDSINVSFHASADTLRPQLDSLRVQNARTLSILTDPAGTHAPGDSLSAVQRDSLVRRRKAAGACLVSLRALEQDTRARVLAALSQEQRAQVAVLEQGQRDAGGPRGDAGGGGGARRQP